MKKLILTSLSAVALVTMIAPAALADAGFAQERRQYDKNFPMESMMNGMGINPYNLVFLAYQGFFDTDGIPGGSSLVMEYRQGNVTAEQLVELANKMNRLSMEDMDSRGFVRAVDNVLSGLVETGS